MAPCLRLASVIMLAFVSFSCTRPGDGMVRGQKAISSILDSVEFVMDDDAGYADSLIRLIEPQSIKSKNLRARYALFYTAVQYKNYQPFTSDSLIMEAVRYYSIDKNLDYRFLSYYYLGCVFLELNNFPDASEAFSQAELLVDKVANDHWKGLFYSRFGFVLSNTCNYKRARDYYSKAEECFEHSGSELHRLYAILYIGQNTKLMNEFSSADSILQIVERESLALGDSSLHYYCFLKRLSCFLFMHDLDLAMDLIERNGIKIDESSKDFRGLLDISHYYTEVKDFAKAESLLERAEQLVKTEGDSISYNYYRFLLADRKGETDKAFHYFRVYSAIQNASLRKDLNQPVLEAQYNILRTMTELEELKARNKITTLVASVILLFLFALMVLLTLFNKKRQTEERIREYIASVNDLTSQISVNKNKISRLNDKVREMLRQQFNSSDYLYTRYYEMDDNRKAERLYRVVRKQLEDFTNRKNIDYIDELLNETFDGIMDKVLSSGIDIKEKDLLMLRFVLAGFSSKSIAALLGDTHLNISQRKKRLLDRIQIKAPELMVNLSIALNIRHMGPNSQVINALR